MKSLLLSGDPERAGRLAAVLRAEGYAPELSILGADTAASAPAIGDHAIVFVDLALGTATACALCAHVRSPSLPLPPLIALVGEPATDDVDRLIAAGANMYIAGDTATLAARLRFLRGAVGGRGRLSKLLADRRRLEDEVRRMLEYAPDAVIVHRDGKILWVNLAACELFAYVREELVGTPVLDLIPPRFRELLAERLQKRAAGQHDLPPLEHPFRRRDGREIEMLVAGGPTIHDGEPALVAFGRDLTERRRLEMQLVAADRLAALGRLAASVGHEINNPLTYVMANLELALRRLHGSPPEVVARMLHDALHGAERIQRIVADLGLLSPRQREVMAALDVREVIESCVRMTAAEIRSRAELVQELDDVPQLVGNAPRLAQVLTNVLLNAVQAIPEGAPGATITITARAAGERVEIRVRDSGVGIAPEHVPHVFEPFFTTRAEHGGTGLGLSICHMLVTAMGGEIAVDSEVGRGTTVVLRLPIVRSPRADLAADPIRGARPPRRVLLVDDEARIADLLRESLLPHEVTVATSGEQALALLAHEVPDAVVCDVMMPRVGGIEIYEHLRAYRPGLERRIVFMTGGAYTERTRSFLATIDNACLGKPFELDSLLDAIEAASAR